MNINLDTYNVKFKDFIKPEKFDSLLQSVKAIQSSIGWDDTDLYYAKLRLSDPGCPKILVKEKSTKKLTGYATVVSHGRVWYISQIAVNKADQRQKIGKGIMQALFAKATERGIEAIYLDTDNENSDLLKFYKSISDRVIERRMGFDRFGKEKVRFIYELANIRLV